jgi:hypothetical protein
MKLRCIKDKETETTGFFNKVQKEFKIEGLTQGKIYTAFLFSKADGSNYTETYPKFLIFNDLNEWGIYPCRFFAPEDQKLR